MYHYENSFITYSGPLPPEQALIVYIIVHLLILAGVITRYQFAKAAGYETAALAFVPLIMYTGSCTRNRKNKL